LEAVLAGDLDLVGPDEVAVADDLFSRDAEAIDAVRRGQDEAGERVGLGPAELEAVRPPDGDVCPLARRQLSDVVAAERFCAPARPQPQRVPHRHRRQPPAPAGDEVGAC
jgi:hypothetical protein